MSPKCEHSLTLEFLTLMSEFDLIRNKISTKILGHSVLFLNLASASALEISKEGDPCGLRVLETCGDTGHQVSQLPLQTCKLEGLNDFERAQKHQPWLEELDLITPRVDLILALASQSSLSVIHRFLLEKKYSPFIYEIIIIKLYRSCFHSRSL